MNLLITSASPPPLVNTVNSVQPQAHVVSRLSLNTIVVGVDNLLLATSIDSIS